VWSCSWAATLAERRRGWAILPMLPPDRYICEAAGL
jgi:hypothetical protein